MNIKKLFKIGLSTSAIALVLTGCGSGGKLYTLKPDFKNYIQKGNEIGIITDSCIYRDEVGEDTDNFSVINSQKANKALLEGLKESLTQNGLKVNYTDSKTVCAFYRDPTLNTNIGILENEKEKIIKGDLPYFTSEMDDEYKKALVNVLQKSYGSSLLKNNFSTVFKYSPNIKEDLAILKKKTNQSKLLIVNSRATDVSAGKAIGEGVATAVLTLGLVSRYSVDNMSLYALVIDLDKGEAIWTSGVRFKKPDMYDKEWYADTYFNSSIKGITDNL